MLARLHDGRIKLYLTWRVSQSRREFDALFRDGDCLPLRADGVARTTWSPSPASTAARRCQWWCRGVGRELAQLPAGARAGRVDALTGQAVGTIARCDAWRLTLAEVFAAFPYALLRPAAASPSNHKERA